MQTLHQELDQTTHEVMADSTSLYVDEVRALRQRVAVLEAELAATKATHGSERPERIAPSLISTDLAPEAESVTSEFCESAIPAVQPAVVAAEPEAGFAQAWTEEAETSSFEERIAAKAFFQASTVDEGSRSWLLDR